jgi:hypothetical protein
LDKILYSFKFSDGSHIHFISATVGYTTIDKMGITKIGTMKYHQYGTHQARMRSFVNWPKQMSQKPEVLTEAGFFYTGSRLIFNSLSQREIDFCFFR